MSQNWELRMIVHRKTLVILSFKSNELMKTMLSCNVKVENRFQKIQWIIMEQYQSVSKVVVRHSFNHHSTVSLRSGWVKILTIGVFGWAVRLSVTNQNQFEEVVYLKNKWAKVIQMIITWLIKVLKRQWNSCQQQVEMQRLVKCRPRTQRATRRAQCTSPNSVQTNRDLKSQQALAIIMALANKTQLNPSQMLHGMTVDSYHRKDQSMQSITNLSKSAASQST